MRGKLASGSSERWTARPFAGRAVSALAAILPVACGVAGALLVAFLVPSPTSVRTSILWWSIFIGGTILPIVVCARLARRLLPLALLLELTMLFPDEAPSRLKIAHRAGRTRDLKKRVEELHQLGEDGETTQVAEAVLELIAHLGMHDRRTRGHSEKVRALTDMLAEEYGLAPDDRDKLRWAALLHDIGKLTVSPDILNKPGRPDESEWATLKKHPTEGERIAEPLWAWMGSWIGAIAQHHEKFDGTGYPHGLAGREISLGGRIVAVADSYETMTATRAYKKPMSVEEARGELVRSSGTHFDPVVVRKFLGISSRRLWVAAGLAALLAQIPVLSGLWTRGIVERVGRTMASVGAATAGVAMLAVGGFLPVTDAAQAPAGRDPARMAAGYPNPANAVAIELLQGWHASPKDKPESDTALATPSVAPVEPVASNTTGAQTEIAEKDAGAPGDDDQGQQPAEPDDPKESPPPYVARAEIRGANPLSRALAGVTQTDFETECRVPLTQGLDGWVFALPAEVVESGGRAAVSGTNAGGDHDLDLLFYSESCDALGGAADQDSDERGALPPGTAYVLVNESSTPGTMVTLIVEAVV